MHTTSGAILSSFVRQAVKHARARYVIPEFLAPRLSELATGRTLSLRHQHRHRHHRCHGLPPTYEFLCHKRHIHEVATKEKCEKRGETLRIPTPSLEEVSDLDAWIRSLKSYLPTDSSQPLLNEEKPTETQIEVSWEQLAIFLLQARFRGHDVISYLGMQLGEWETTVWILKKIIEGQTEIEPPPQFISPFDNIQWEGHGTLKELTEEPIWATLADTRSSLRYKLDETTGIPSDLASQLRLRKEVLGSIWKSLGMMIVAAVERGSTDTSIMPPVLEIIAHLHHLDVVPSSIYTYNADKDSSTPQPPPILHILSGQILESLSDATWRAQETSHNRKPDEWLSPQFLGFKVPGFRYKVTVRQVAPEVWLELVLWSCVHGGWALEGASIVEALASKNAEGSWSALYWRDITDAAEHPEHAPFSHNPEFFDGRFDPKRLRRTISSEVVTALIDGLLNDIRVGVGNRGLEPAEVMQRILALKKFLDRENLGLGSTTWDAVLVRFFESEGIVLERDPDLVMELLQLAHPFGKELGYINSPQQEMESEQPFQYYLDASAIALGLMHRTIRAYISLGDLQRALDAFRRLQEFTDLNKKLAVGEFFSKLKAMEASTSSSEESNDAIEFPGFDPQIPPALLAGIMDAAIESKAYDFARWLIYSNDLDGPLVGRGLYADPVISPSLVRLGSATRDKELIASVIAAQSVQSSKKDWVLPPNLLLAFLHSEIERHQWESVSSIIPRVAERMNWSTHTVAVLAREILRLGGAHEHQMRGHDDSLAMAEELLSSFLRGRYGTMDRKSYMECNSVLGILSTLDSRLAQFCRTLFSRSGDLPIKLSTDEFNVVLEGILDGYGLDDVMRILNIWGGKISKELYEPPAPGGLPTMAQYRTSWAAQLDKKDSGQTIRMDEAPITFQGRIKPKLQTVRLVLRKVASGSSAGKIMPDSEADGTGARGSSGDDEVTARDIAAIVKWATGSMRAMGLNESRIDFELARLTKRTSNGDQQQQQQQAAVSEAGGGSTGGEQWSTADSVSSSIYYAVDP